jgi:hypothetical protein
VGRSFAGARNGKSEPFSIIFLLDQGDAAAVGPERCGSRIGKGADAKNPRPTNRALQESGGPISERAFRAEAGDTRSGYAPAADRPSRSAEIRLTSGFFADCALRLVDPCCADGPKKRR